MSFVVKIGGCNGSGKTSLARAIIELSDAKPFKPRNWRKVQAYMGLWEGIPITVLGSYENVCGGMDTISDKDVRFKLVKDYSALTGIVFFEGLITGKTFGALGALSNEQRGRWLYAFMDTPFEVCVERVLARRAAKGNLAEFDPERTMRPTFKSCTATMHRAATEGHSVYDVMYRMEPRVAAMDLLRKATSYANR